MRFKLTAAFRRFFARESSSGILLAACTVLALLIANSPWHDAYAAVLHVNIAGMTLHHWINDGLMVIFFFVVGMEIKREIVEGELASPAKASLPILAALGGMVGPALVYLALNREGPAARGWGVPMATDIAFAVAALSIFGRRAPGALKVFLLALAIVDDLGAVVVIAVFYTEKIAGPFLGLAALGLGAVALCRRAGFHRYGIYIVLGIVVWYGVLRSGVHATIAGVLIGLFTPLRFPGGDRSKAPLGDLLHLLHPVVGYFIMPVFALSNAGVRMIGIEPASILENSVFLGIAAGLCLGKPAGILSLSYLGTRLRVAKLPHGVGWGALVGVGFLGGIGFTMALFIEHLALPEAYAAFAKAAILLGSTAAGLVGVFILAKTLPRARP